jgi:hypothetical protein
MALIWLPVLASPPWAAEDAGGAAPSAETAREPRALLPASGELSGWTLSEEPRQFAAADLWQHINGADEQYLSHGCSSLAVAYYTHAGSEAEIAVEIYGMADTLGAFGIYALERPADKPVQLLGAQGYRAGGEVTFFGGTFYCKLSAYPDGPDEQEAVWSMASLIAARHLAGSRMPGQLDFFPRENLEAGALRLAPRAILGIGKLPGAIVATYRHGEEEMLLHWGRQDEADSAQAAYATLRSALERRSEIPLQSVTVGPAAGVAGEMKYQGPVLLLVAGRDVILASRTVAEPWSREAIGGLLANLGH